MRTLCRHDDGFEILNRQIDFPKTRIQHSNNLPCIQTLGIQCLPVPGSLQRPGIITTEQGDTRCTLCHCRIARLSGYIDISPGRCLQVTRLSSQFTQQYLVYHIAFSHL